MDRSGCALLARFRRCSRAASGPFRIRLPLDAGHGKAGPCGLRWLGRGFSRASLRLGGFALSLGFGGGFLHCPALARFVSGGLGHESKLLQYVIHVRELRQSLGARGGVTILQRCQGRREASSP